MVRTIESLQERRTLFFAALFLASAFLMTLKIASPARFEIAIDVEGTVVIGAIPQVYAFVDIITVAVFAVVLGATGYYLVRSGMEGHEPSTSVTATGEPSQSENSSATVDATAVIARLLEGETRNVYQTILKHGGEILQKELVLEAQLPKATVSRALSSLEAKGLINRTPHGLTNKIVVVRGLEDILSR